MHRPSRSPLRLGLALSVAIVLLSAACILVYLNQEVVRFTLSHWTGEEDLKEQLKGTLTLAWLTLTQPPPRTDPYVPLAHTGVSPYGVNTFLEQEPDADKVERSLRLVADSGFHWIRQEFPWEDIEISAKGDFEDHKWNVSAWAKYDRIVELAERYGIEIIARLDHPPAWSRQVGNAPGWTMGPPDNLQDYGDFVAAVVGRYRGSVRYYQIWNEPNIFPEWGDQPANPAAYVELLKIAYRRAKEADPDCVILAAGLAQTTEETAPEFGPRNVSDLLYLQRMYEAGARGYFDIMGAMVYGLWTGPYDRRTSRDRANFSRVQLLREVMVRNGDADKPIWATEVGWNAMPADLQVPASYGRVSEEQQAVYAVEAYQRAEREWPWMGVMNYWFLRRPSDSEKGQAWYYFRMLEPDFAELPVRGTLSWLAKQPPTVFVGYHQEDHWALHFEGHWEHVTDADAVLGAYALGDLGARLSFFFAGTELALVVRDKAQLDNLEVLVDDTPVRPEPSRMGVTSQSEVVPVVRGLPDTRHRAEVSVTRGSVALDGLVVRRGESLDPRGLAVGAIGGMAVMALAWVARRSAGRQRDA